MKKIGELRPRASAPPNAARRLPCRCTTLSMPLGFCRCGASITTRTLDQLGLFTAPATARLLSGVCLGWGDRDAHREPLHAVAAAPDRVGHARAGHPIRRRHRALDAAAKRPPPRTMPFPEGRRCPRRRSLEMRATAGAATATPSARRATGRAATRPHPTRRSSSNRHARAGGPFTQPRRFVLDHVRGAGASCRDVVPVLDARDDVLRGHNRKARARVVAGRSRRRARSGPKHPRPTCRPARARTRSAQSPPGPAAPCHLSESPRGPRNSITRPRPRRGRTPRRTTTRPGGRRRPVPS